MKKETGKGSQKKPKHNIDKGRQPAIKPLQKSGAESKYKQESEQPGIKFEWKFKNPKFRSSLLFLVSVIFFLFIWKEPEVKSVDPWYEGYLMVDSAMKSGDPNLKSDLMNRGSDLLRQMARDYPFHSKVHLLLGIYFEVAGKWDSAIAEHKESLKLGTGGTINPIEQDAKRQLLICYLNKSNQLLQLGNYTDARKTVDDALSQNLNHPDLDNQIGIIFHRQDFLDSAEFYYNKVLAASPQHQSASANLGLIYYVKGNNFLKAKRFDQALQMYQKSVSLNPKNSDLYTNMGYLFSLQNKAEDAVIAYQKAVELKPDNKFAISGLYNAYKRHGDIQQAEALAKQYGLNQ